MGKLSFCLPVGGYCMVNQLQLTALMFAANEKLLWDTGFPLNNGTSVWVP
jgi:hypothetical protein